MGRNNHTLRHSGLDMGFRRPDQIAGRIAAAAAAAILGSQLGRGIKSVSTETNVIGDKSEGSCDTEREGEREIAVR